MSQTKDAQLMSQTHYSQSQYETALKRLLILASAIFLFGGIKGELRTPLGFKADFKTQYCVFMLVDKALAEYH
jgi:hypothetical protein